MSAIANFLHVIKCFITNHDDEKNVQEKFELCLNPPRGGRGRGGGWGVEGVQCFPSFWSVFAFVLNAQWTDFQNSGSIRKLKTWRMHRKVKAYCFQNTFLEIKAFTFPIFEFSDLFMFFMFLDVPARFEEAPIHLKSCFFMFPRSGDPSWMILDRFGKLHFFMKILQKVSSKFWSVSQLFSILIP